MKKAFTLIELIVVVGIIVILIGTLLATISNGTESARAAKCLTNLKNLATACNSYAMASGHYPLAGSVESRNLDSDKSSGGSVSFRFYEHPGWISWNSQDKYPTHPDGQRYSTSHAAEKSWFTSAYNSDPEVRRYALRNGALWGSLAGNEEVFVCPVHRRRMKKENPIWSYVMNQKFGYDESQGDKPRLRGYGIEYGHLDRNPDRVLLFAELQFLPNDAVKVNTDEGSGFVNDCTLQYGQNEILGFNHPNGKRGLFAHVAFADGHTEKLAIPASPSDTGWTLNISVSSLKDLTKWLCEGYDVSFNEKERKYEKFND